MKTKKPKALFPSFTKREIALWSVSIILIVGSFFLFDRGNILTLAASLIGVTSLIFNAKGNPFGQFLMILFSLLYGTISFSFAYYGEMATYLGMTLPMSVFALISWIRNPYNGNKSEVKVNRLKKREVLFIILLTTAVTSLFFFILKTFHTPNLIPSTLSVATSFLAVYLTFRRSIFHTLAYAANDTILITLWVLAARSDRSYLSVALCFAIFLINDLYGFLSWSQMQKRQESSPTSPANKKSERS